MEREKKLLYGGVAVIVSLVLAAALYVVVNQPIRVKENCKPMSYKPNMDEIEIKNFASEDGLVVANLAGYLELSSSTGNSTYLALSFNSVQVTIPESDDLRRVTLEGDCFRFIVEYTFQAEYATNYYQFSNLEMLVKNDAEPDNRLKKICQFDNQFSSKMVDSKYYSCKLQLYHQCTMNGKQVASLMLKSFELELDGKRDHVMEGKFSKLPFEDSCPNWDS